MIAHEEWRAVVGVPGYEISSRGRCRSVSRDSVQRRVHKSGTRFTTTRRLNGRLLSPFVERYVSFALGKRLRLRAHVMVAAAFLGPCPDGMWVLHNDGDPLNNRLDNLRYGTPSDNHEDRRRHGRTFEGERNGCAKLTAAAAAQILVDDRLHREIAAAHGVSASTIGNIKRGESWASAIAHAVSGDAPAAVQIIRDLRANQTGEA